MIHASTVNKLNEMRLTAMADAFRQQLQDSTFEPLSFEERFSLIVDIEWARRKNNRLTKLIRTAGFPQSDACIENIEYHADRKLDKIYQIYTYVKNSDKYATGNVAGVLLYAKTDEAINPNDDFNLGGNKISLRTLDLNQEWKALTYQLDKLCAWLDADECA